MKGIINIKMRENKENTRVIYTDLLRILSICAIILLHVASKNMWAYSVEDRNFKIYTIYSCMTRWGVPIFFMISGSFLLQPEKNITRNKISAYCKRLLVAYIIWSCIYAIWNTVMEKGFSLNALDIGMLKLVIDGPYHFWFMFVMLGLYIVTPYLRKLVATSSKDELRNLLCIWAFFSIVVPVLKTYNFDGNLVNLIERTKMIYCTGYFGYYFLGYYMSKYEVWKRQSVGVYLLFLMSMVLTVSFTFQIESLNGMRNDFWQDNFSPTVVLTAMTLFSIFKNLEDYLNRIFNEKMKHRIVILANASFGVYLIHDLFITLLWKLQIDTMRFNPVLSVPMISIIIIALSFPICVGWQLLRIK